jgi:hypothetical protein
MQSNPIEGKDKEAVKFLREEHARSETTSLTLAGFTLTALVFILQLQSTADSIFVQNLTTFFSIGMILEISSALLYRHIYRQRFPYLGFVTQYGGLLALFNGFFAYLTSKFIDSQLIWISYSIGLVLFFILTGQELRLYIKQWKY